MLSEIFKPQDIANRYGCSVRTARRYMRQMRHTENPLTVTEQAIRDWDLMRTVYPPNEKGWGIPRR